MTAGSLDRSWRGVLRVIAARRLQFFVLSAVLMAAVALTYVVRGDLYRASASFAPQPSGGTSALRALSAQFGFDPGSAEPSSSPDFYVDLVQTDGFLARLVNAKYASSRNPGDSMSLIDYYGLADESRARREEAAIRRLRRQYWPRVNRRSGIVTVTVQDRSPAIAQAIAARVLHEVDVFNASSRQSRASAERRFVEGRLEMLRSELAASEARLAEFLLRNRSLVDPEIRLTAERLERDVNLRQAMVTALSQTYEQARVDEVRDTPLTTVVQQPRLPTRPSNRPSLTKGVFVATLCLLAAALITAHDRLRPAVAHSWRRFVATD